MKKVLLSLLFSLVASSCLLAQEVPLRHLEATYSSSPKATITWVADLQNETAPYLYQVTVTVQNNTSKVFQEWNLGMIFLGSIIDCSSEISIYTSMFSDGPAPGYAIFGKPLEHGEANIPPHGNASFQYTYQLPASQQTIEAPLKFMLSRSVSYLMRPDDQPVSR